MQSYVVVNNVCLDLPNGRNLFNNINFTLGAKLSALVGPNGVGKTSLAKLITGEVASTSGDIRRNGDVAYLPQREVADVVTVADYLASRYVWSMIGDKLLADIDQNRLCTQLSGGEWMRVRLAAVINEQYLILDEPTNDLDRKAKKILVEFLQEYQYGVLLISHDRELLQRCDQILELSNRGIQKYGGNWQFYEFEKEREREQSQNSLERAKKEKEKAVVKRQLQVERQDKRNSKGRKAALEGGMPKILLGARKRQAMETTGKVDSKTMDAVTSKVKEAQEAFNAIKIDPIMYADLIGSEIPSSKIVVEARDFNVNLGRKLFQSNLNFSWKGSFRIAIKGDNGSGKTTLLNALTGKNLPCVGELRLGGVTTMYLDQQCSMINDSLSVIDNVRTYSNLSESELRGGLAKFLFMADSVFQKGDLLSGGERLRAALACGLLAKDKVELIILDEPTNNLDIKNISFLEGLIAHFKGAVIIVSHDEVFLKRCRIDDWIEL